VSWPTGCDGTIGTIGNSFKSSNLLCCYAWYTTHADKSVLVPRQGVQSFGQSSILWLWTHDPTLPAPLFGRVALPDSRRRFAVIFHREFREKASVNWGFVDGAHRRLGLKLQNSLYFSLIAGRRVRSRPLPPPVQFREGSPARSCSAESRNICGHS
jgi:hypothetical protein